VAPYLIFFIFSALGLAWGTWTDFKERIVSDWATWGMLVLGLGGHAVWAFLANDAMIFANSLGITIATFYFAYLLYRLGAWAGGDVKLFAGLAALNPFNPAILWRMGVIGIPELAAINVPIFPLTLFMFSLFSMLPYGAFLAAARLAKNKKEKKKFGKEFGKKAFQSAEASAAIVGLNALLLFFGFSQWLVLPLLFFLAFLPKRFGAIVSGCLLLLGLWLNLGEAIMQFVGITLLFMGIWLLFKLYYLSKVLMRKKVPVQKLEEGMVVAQSIMQFGKKFEIVKGTGIKSLIKYFAQNRSGKALGKEIVSSRAAGGLTKEEISKLKRLASAGKIPKGLEVRETAPFVPAVLIAYVILNVVGDVIWVLVF